MNIKKRLAFVFALSALMLASCSNDEALVEGTVDGGQKIRMTVTAQREGAGADSRTSLEDKNTGKLDCVWTEGDRLIVTNAEGKIKGHLDLISGAGEGFASFSGDLYGVKDGEAVFNYYYLGTKNNATALADVPNPYTVDYSNQAGTLESLSEYDVMTATAQVNVNKGNAPVENIRLERRISFARFQVNLPEDATVTHPCQVTLSGEQLANSLSLNMQTREVTTTKGNVTVTTSAEGDFYMTYLPTASPYTLTFTATDGTNTYEGEYTVKSVIGENVYFRKKLENAGNVDYVGIPVTMNPAEKYTLCYHANFEGAEPESFEDVQYKAPAVFTLKEYADTGLPSREGYTFLGWANSASATQPDITGSSITLNEDDKNTPRDVYAVWEETKKSYNPGDTGSWGGENIDPAYELGTVTWTTDEDCWTVNCRNMAHTGGFGTYITYTHNGIQNNLLTSKGTTAYFFQWGRWLGYPSTAARTYFQNDEVHGSYPVSSQYLNGINIYNTKLGYVGDDGLVPSYVAAYMGGNNSFTRKKALNWSILFGMVSSFVGGHGDYIYANEECRWEERCGNPCPDGYRVPTASELEALIPTTGEISGKCAEIKKINGVSYAMRWQVVTGTLPYVEIKSVKTTLTQITFDNAIFNSAPAIRLYAYGYMDNEGYLQGRGSVGVYWSSESGVNTISNTTGNGGKYLEIDFSGSKAVMGIGVALRCFGAPVMPIKDDNAKTATLTPLLPLIVYHEDCKFF